MLSRAALNKNQMLHHVVNVHVDI